MSGEWRKAPTRKPSTKSTATNDWPTPRISISKLKRLAREADKYALETFKTLLRVWAENADQVLEQKRGNPITAIELIVRRRKDKRPQFGRRR